METSTIEIGTICVLKSGGPPMTVTEIGMDHFGVRVSWFDKQNNERFSHFPMSCLDFLIECDKSCDCDNPLGHAG